MTDSNKPYVPLAIGAKVTVSRVVDGYRRTNTLPVSTVREQLRIGEIAIIARCSLIDRTRTSITPGVQIPDVVPSQEDYLYHLRREAVPITQAVANNIHYKLQVEDKKTHLPAKDISLTPNGPSVGSELTVGTIVYLLRDVLYWAGSGVKATLQAGTRVAIGSEASTGGGSGQSTYIKGGPHYAIQGVKFTTENMEWKADHPISAIHVTAA